MYACRMRNAIRTKPARQVIRFSRIFPPQQTGQSGSIGLIRSSAQRPAFSENATAIFSTKINKYPYMASNIPLLCSFLFKFRRCVSTICLQEAGVRIHSLI